MFPPSAYSSRPEDPGSQKDNTVAGTAMFAGIILDHFIQTIMMPAASPYNFFYRNSLCIVFLSLMICSLFGQVYTGWLEHNDFLSDYRQAPQSLTAYLSSGHFIQATFENWESEFFQMALFVILTIFLRQQGSSESKDCNEKLFDQSELVPKKDSPWPVKKGGIFISAFTRTRSL